ncbi:MAG: hypothetical protein ACOC22_02880 [bacterium]
MKPIYKKVKIEIEKAFCPKCGQVLDEVSDPDARMIMKYHCKECNYYY